ncbi:MAG: MTAP family purine nucleoside phosphorylase [Bacillota bacterium]
MLAIPRAEFAVIGGSGTFKINFPEDLAVDGEDSGAGDLPGINVLAAGLVLETPFGKSPPLKLFAAGEKRVLTVKMHGWRGGVARADASRQLFWVFREAGVKKIIAEGGVGAVSHLFRIRDVVLPSDYLDFSLRKDVRLSDQYLLAMRQAVCPEIKEALKEAARRQYVRVFDRGVYAVTDGRHFESPAEVAMLRILGADVVGQSMCPEVYLAREIGACYARLDIVVNYAEGVVEDWRHEDLKDIFHTEGKRIGRVVLAALGSLDAAQDCGCPQLRYPTLLTEE